MATILNQKIADINSTPSVYIHFLHKNKEQFYAKCGFKTVKLAEDHLIKTTGLINGL